ncbi:hypothetical protein [Echinococcus multilocularis]|uniref:Uncharacterized protein n=1 Tax=Echinococcus multilocularis TaxID=6211 RepID=A0A0S4MMB7_ECHMU|nr:hypothetical protein [Echinococcus multilocularis]
MAWIGYCKQFIHSCEATADTYTYSVSWTNRHAHLCRIGNLILFVKSNLLDIQDTGVCLSLAHPTTHFEGFIEAYRQQVNGRFRISATTGSKMKNFGDNYHDREQFVLGNYDGQTTALHSNTRDKQLRPLCADPTTCQYANVSPRSRRTPRDTKRRQNPDASESCPFIQQHSLRITYTQEYRASHGPACRPILQNFVTRGRACLASSNRFRYTVSAIIGTSK